MQTAAILARPLEAVIMDPAYEYVPGLNMETYIE